MVKLTISLYGFVLLHCLHFTPECNGISAFKPCPTLQFNGKMRTKQRGKLARFQCNWGFDLMGQKYASCINGAWDSPVPMCIRAGCKRMPNPENGLLIYTRRNAGAMFFCNPGYSTVGSSLLFCNGSTWNGTAPTCESKVKSNPATSCDFENEDMCGWSHDLYHDFDWLRKNNNTPGFVANTGPAYDHTLGEGKEGHYMYIEGSTDVMNETARLISPIFPAYLSQEGCFSFYYHMYGRFTGSLRILMHPTSIELLSILSDSSLKMKYTMFQTSGNHGNNWLKGFFDLDVTQENFQIVLEGVRGVGYVSHIAVDDVAILQAEQCAQEKLKQIGYTVTYVANRDSCANRCNQKPNATGVDEAADCLCHEDCEDQHTCCPDYRDLCVFSSTDGGETPTQESVLSVSSQPPPLPPSLKMTATNAPNTNSIIKTSMISSTVPTTPKLTTIPTPTTVSTKLTTKSTTPQPVNPSTKPTPKKIITTPKPTTQKTIRTTQSTAKTMKTTPVAPTLKVLPTRGVLQFYTPALPYKNVTGILKKAIDEVETMPELVARKNNETAKQIIGMKTDQSNQGNQEIELNDPTVKSTAMPTIAKYSKTFDHYSKKYPVKAIFEVTTSVAQKKQLNFKSKSEKLISYNSDAHTANADQIAPSSSVGIIVFSVFLLIGSISGVILTIRYELLRKLVDKRRRIRLNSGSTTNSDMKFLVQDEELEHDYDD